MALIKAYLESVVETVKEFQIWRIKWAIQLNYYGEEVIFWKVVRIAALGENYSEVVKAALEDELAKQYNLWISLI